MFLQKYSSKTYQGISSSKTKSNAISKEQKCYAEKVAPRKHLTGEVGNGLCFTETSLSKISQPKKQASETDNFNPHWRVVFFFLPPSVKNHTQGERRWAFPLSPHKQRLLTPRQSASPFGSEEVVPGWIISPATNAKNAPSIEPQSFGLWVRSVRYVCVEYGVWFFLKAGVLTLLVFICVAQTNGTLSIKLLSRAS